MVSVSEYIIDYKNIIITVYKRVEENFGGIQKTQKGALIHCKKSRLDFFGYKEGVREQFLEHRLIHYIHFSFKLSFADSYIGLSSLNGHSYIANSSTYDRHHKIPFQLPHKLWIFTFP